MGGGGSYVSSSSNQTFGNKNQDLVYGLIRQSMDEAGIDRDTIFNQAKKSMSKLRWTTPWISFQVKVTFIPPSTKITSKQLMEIRKEAILKRVKYDIEMVIYVCIMPVLDLILKILM